MKGFSARCFDRSECNNGEGGATPEDAACHTGHVARSLAPRPHDRCALLKPPHALAWSPSAQPYHARVTGKDNTDLTRLSSRAKRPGGKRAMKPLAYRESPS